MLSTRRFTLALVTATVIFATASASAQQEPGEAGVTERARAHFERGVALYSDGALDAALVEFRTSYEIEERPQVLYNIGVVQRELRRYADAVDTLRRYLAEAAGADQPADRRAAVEQLIEELEALLGTLVIETEPSDGVDVLIEGELAGQTPLDEPLRLEAGEYQLELRLDGYTTRRLNVEVRSQRETRQRVELERLPTPLVRRWWFWTAISVLVTGAALAIALPLTIEPDGADFGQVRLVVE